MEGLGSTDPRPLSYEKATDEAERAFLFHGKSFSLRATVPESVCGVYFTAAYSAFACFSSGISGSASFHSARKSWYAIRLAALSPCME